jgi:hypothetical protein
MSNGATIRLVAAPSGAPTPAPQPQPVAAVPAPQVQAASIPQPQPVAAAPASQVRAASIPQSQPVAAASAPRPTQAPSSGMSVNARPFQPSVPTAQARTPAAANPTAVPADAQGDEHLATQDFTASQAVLAYLMANHTSELTTLGKESAVRIKRDSMTMLKLITPKTNKQQLDHVYQRICALCRDITETSLQLRVQDQQALREHLRGHTGTAQVSIVPQGNGIVTVSIAGPATDVANCVAFLQQ